MKVLLVNGSPHKNGSTDRALQEVAKTLEAGGVETEIFWIGTAPIGGCIGCGGCGKKGECVFGGPVVEFVRKAKTADGSQELKKYKTHKEIIEALRCLDYIYYIGEL